MKIVFKFYNPNFGMNYLNQFACVLRHSVIATPWTIAYQVPLSMGFFRKEYWSGLPFSSPGHLPDPGIESVSPAFQADSLPLSPKGSPPHTWQVLNKSSLSKQLFIRAKYEGNNRYFIITEFPERWFTFRSKWRKMLLESELIVYSYHQC